MHAIFINAHRPEREKPVSYFVILLLPKAAAVRVEKFHSCPFTRKMRSCYVHERHIALPCVKHRDSHRDEPHVERGEACAIYSRYQLFFHGNAGGTPGAFPLQTTITHPPPPLT